MKTYKVTVSNKSNELRATLIEHGVKNLLQAMVELTSFYQPGAIELLAKLMNTDVDNIVDEVMNREYLDVDNIPNLNPSLLLTFDSEDDGSEPNGIFLDFSNKNAGELFVFEAYVKA